MSHSRKATGVPARARRLRSILSAVLLPTFLLPTAMRTGGSALVDGALMHASKMPERARERLAPQEIPEVGGSGEKRRGDEVDEEDGEGDASVEEGDKDEKMFLKPGSSTRWLSEPPI
mgnify:CR=1 FL=1